MSLEIKSTEVPSVVPSEKEVIIGLDDEPEVPRIITIMAKLNDEVRIVPNTENRLTSYIVNIDDDTSYVYIPSSSFGKSVNGEDVTETRIIDGKETTISKVLEQRVVKRVRIDYKSAMLSSLLKKVLTEDSYDSTVSSNITMLSDEKDPVILAPKLDYEAIKLVADFMDYHYKNHVAVNVPEKVLPTPIPSHKEKEMESFLSDFDAEFMRKWSFDSEQKLNIGQLGFISHWLDIPYLSNDLIGAKIASMVKGRSNEEIKKLFNLPSN